MRAVLALLAIPVAMCAATPDQIRAAANRAIRLMQASQKEWDEGWSCASCHHQYLTAIALRDAKDRGLPIDEKTARADAAMAFRANLDSAIQSNRSIEPSIGDGYRLWAFEASGRRNTLPIQADVRLMAGRQKADGHWSTMDQRPPQSNSPFTATALAVRSLVRYSHPSMAAEVKDRIARARAWLQNNTAGDTESRTFRLLGLYWSGGDTEAATKALLETQNPNGGGWGTVEGHPSNAYSTSQALVALADAGGIPVSDPRWQRGIAFLLKTQATDGSWHVPTGLHPPAPLSPEYFESGYPYEHDQYLSIMGASWSVMALARALSPQRDPAIPSEQTTAWPEKVLFGTLEDLRHLLDNGFDPNSATEEGTTALMMAIPDLNKVKLLLDRGARASARANSKFNAVSVAAQYRESAPVIDLLLSHGADVVSPAMTLAASSGNAAALSLLHAAGGQPDETSVLGGVLQATPLLLAAMNGDAATVRAVLDLGADVNKPDPEGLTALIWATLANRYEVVRLLLDRGADPNRVDRYRMTALLYAASVDYGDTRVLDALLAAGAKLDAKNEEGLTALGRALKFGHTKAAARLREAGNQK
jgi:ankyrin repeat protein